MTVTRGLITLDDIKRSLSMPSTTTSEDSDLEGYIEAATPVIENIVGPVLQRTQTSLFDGGRNAIRLPWPVTQIVAVLADGTALAEYVGLPDAGVIYADGAGGCFASGSRNIAVTFIVGVATLDQSGTPQGVPPHVKLATRELVRHWWQIGRQASHGYAAGGDPDDGGGLTGFAVPRRVTELLKPSALIGGFA